MRHPYEMGGGYFSLTLFTTPFVCLYFGSRYLSYVSDEEVRVSLPFVFTAGQVYGAIGGLAVLQVINFSVLMRTIEAKYRKTFWSFQTGSQFGCYNFKEPDKDSTKFDIFSDNKALWEPIKEEVKDWLNK